jgi:hypothetical protein
VGAVDEVEHSSALLAWLHNLALPVVFRIQDRELVAVVRSAPRAQDKLMDEMVERRAGVVEEVSEDYADARPDLGQVLRDQAVERLIRWVLLGAHRISVAFSKQPEFFCDRLQVLLCAVELGADAR